MVLNKAAVVLVKLRCDIFQNALKILLFTNKNILTMLKFDTIFIILRISYKTYD